MKDEIIIVEKSLHKPCDFFNLFYCNKLTIFALDK